MEPEDNNSSKKTNEENSVLVPHIDEILKVLLTNPNCPNNANFITEEDFQMETTESEHDQSICDAITAHDEEILRDINTSTGDTNDLLEINESPQIDAKESGSGRKESNNELSSPTTKDEDSININDEISPKTSTEAINIESGSVQPPYDKEEEMDLDEPVGPVADCSSPSDEFIESSRIDEKGSGSGRKNTNSDHSTPTSKDEVTININQEISPKDSTEEINIESGSVQPTFESEEDMDLEEPIAPVTDGISHSVELKESPRIHEEESGSGRKNSNSDHSSPAPKTEITKDIYHEISPKNFTETSNNESGSVQPTFDNEEDMKDVKEPIPPVTDCNPPNDESNESPRTDVKVTGSSIKNTNSDHSSSTSKDEVTININPEISPKDSTEAINIESGSVQQTFDNEEEMDLDKSIAPVTDDLSHSNEFKDSSRNEVTHKESSKRRSKNVLNDPAFTDEVTLRKSPRLSRMSNRDSGSAQPALASKEDMEDVVMPILISASDELKESSRIDAKGRGSLKKKNKNDLSSPSINSCNSLRRSSRLSSLESSRALSTNANEENKEDLERSTAPAAESNLPSDVLTCKICSVVTASEEDLRKHMTRCRRKKH